MTKIIAVTACPSGVAHTYMAAEALESAAKAKGWEVKVETQGSIGLENELTAEDVASADMVILTKDIGIKFEERFLQRLRLWGVSCAIETAGDAPASRLLPLAKLCDEVLFDLKIMDPTRARDVVKMNLPRVLENLRLLVSEGINVIPRLPLIPGYTLSRENMQQALDVLIPLNIRQIHLLPFHQYGEPKYRLLGREWSMKDIPAPSSADVALMREMAEQAGFQVTVGG